MAGLRLFWRYPSDVVGAIVATSTTAGFPVRNLQRATLSSKHKTGATLATETWTVDTGVAEPRSAFFLGGHDFKSGDTLTLTYADDAGFTVGTGAIPVTYRAGFLLEFFSAQVKRYWRLSNLKTSPTETRQAGRLVIGPHTNLTYSLRLGYGVGARSDTSRKIRTEGGQQYADIGVVIHGQRGSLVVTDSERDEIEAMRETLGTAVPFISAIDWDSYPAERSLYGFFVSLGEPADTAVGHWTYPWDMVEQL